MSDRRARPNAEHDDLSQINLSRKNDYSAK